MLSLIKPVAETKLKRVLKLEKTTTADTKKALQLINIINQANWDNLTAHDLAVIKAKSSHSRWYTSGLGSMHQPSEYLTVVPVSVAKEAKLVQKIRRKHQKTLRLILIKLVTIAVKLELLTMKIVMAFVILIVYWTIGIIHLTLIS